MERRFGLAIPLAYALLLVCGVLWGTGHQPPPHAQAHWLSAPLLSRLESSYLRCLRRRWQQYGWVLSDEDEARMLAYERDFWATSNIAIEAIAAPIERVGRRAFIRCTWLQLAQ